MSYCQNASKEVACLLERAREYCLGLECKNLSTCHVLCAFLYGTTPQKQFLYNYGFTWNKVYSTFLHGSNLHDVHKQVLLSKATGKIIDFACRVARGMNSEEVLPHHLFIALLMDDKGSASVVIEKYCQRKMLLEDYCQAFGIKIPVLGNQVTIEEVV